MKFFSNYRNLNSKTNKPNLEEVNKKSYVTTLTLFIVMNGSLSVRIILNPMSPFFRRVRWDLKCLATTSVHQQLLHNIGLAQNIPFKLPFMANLQNAISNDVAIHQAVTPTVYVNVKRGVFRIIKCGVAWRLSARCQFAARCFVSAVCCKH